VSIPASDKAEADAPAARRRVGQPVLETVLRRDCAGIERGGGGQRRWRMSSEAVGKMDKIGFN
jgi:hypothetical protein